MDHHLDSFWLWYMFFCSVVRQFSQIPIISSISWFHRKNPTRNKQTLFLSSNIPMSPYFFIFSGIFMQSFETSSNKINSLFQSIFFLFKVSSEKNNFPVFLFVSLFVNFKFFNVSILLKLFKFSFKNPTRWNLQLLHNPFIKLTLYPSKQNVSIDAKQQGKFAFWNTQLECKKDLLYKVCPIWS